LVHGRYGVISAERGNRVAGVGAAIVVHVLLIAFVLSGLPRFGDIPVRPHETIILLMPIPAPVKVPQKTPARPTEIIPMVRFPDSASAPTITTAPQQLVIPTLRCAPENLSNLSPEEQAKCGSFGLSVPDKNAVIALRSHVKDLEMRAAELSARRAPTRVDCTRTTSRVIANIAQDNGVMIDSACVLGQLKRALGR